MIIKMDVGLKMLDNGVAGRWCLCGVIDSSDDDVAGCDYEMSDNQKPYPDDPDSPNKP